MFLIDNEVYKNIYDVVKVGEEKLNLYHIFLLLYLLSAIEHCLHYTRLLH